MTTLTLAEIGAPERGNASQLHTRPIFAHNLKRNVSVMWRWSTRMDVAEWSVYIHDEASPWETQPHALWVLVTPDADEAIAAFNDPEAHRLRFLLGAR
jgi:hypothetical protein